MATDVGKIFASQGRTIPGKAERVRQFRLAGSVAASIISVRRDRGGVVGESVSPQPPGARPRGSGAHRLM